MLSLYITGQEPIGLSRLDIYPDIYYKTRYYQGYCYGLEQDSEYIYFTPQHRESKVARFNKKTEDIDMLDIDELVEPGWHSATIQGNKWYITMANRGIAVVDINKWEFDRMLNIPGFNKSWHTNSIMFKDGYVFLTHHNFAHKRSVKSFIAKYSMVNDALVEVSAQECGVDIHDLVQSYDGLVCCSSAEKKIIGVNSNLVINIGLGYTRSLCYLKDEKYIVGIDRFAKEGGHRDDDCKIGIVNNHKLKRVIELGEGSITGIIPAG